MNIGVAVSVGWKQVQASDGFWETYYKEEYICSDCEQYWPTWKMPNYCSDLNAIQKAVLTLNPTQQVQYVNILEKIVSDGSPFNWRGFTFANATAKQRTEAYLKTIEKFI